MQTGISQIYPDRIIVKGYNLVDLARKYHFGDLIFLMATGELPKNGEGDLVEAMLVICADHGVEAPSTLTARLVANTGAPLESAIAAGVSAISENHGGAGEALAKLLQETIAQHPGESNQILAHEIVCEWLEKKQRLPGIGHRFHNPDPRAEYLIQFASERNFSGAHLELAMAIKEELVIQSGVNRPLNVDGALAALLSDLGIHWSFAKALFIISRTAGLAAHVIEEKASNQPFRLVTRKEIEYIGPKERPLSS